MQQYHSRYLLVRVQHLIVLRLAAVKVKIKKLLAVAKIAQKQLVTKMVKRLAIKIPQKLAIKNNFNHSIKYFNWIRVSNLNLNF